MMQILLGGSFDPVHNGHIALGDYFVKLLVPDALRIVPAGNPWQKHGLSASAEQRVEMLRLAFDRQPVPVVIDMQEIERKAVTYTIETLRAIRTELGPRASIAFLLGADQLQTLETWHEWQALFEFAHLCAAARPGFPSDVAQLPAAVAREFERRAATPEQIRNTPHGLTYLARNLAVDVSATQIRAALQRGESPVSLAPAGVLDYIQRHNLYRN
jgi:nicotinate-nucleotide adenylyltransferase